MPRLYLFAEGQTEQTFADTVLKPHLAHHRVYMHNPVLIAHCRKKGRTHRGGTRKYLPIRNDIIRFLKQETGNDVFFTSMVDLYGLPSDFPGNAEAEALRHDPAARVGSLEGSWSLDIADRRFIPFISLHEYEGLLFTDISQLTFFFGPARSRIARLQRIADGFASPELIDDGVQTAPSKRITAEFPEYEGAKRTVGPQTAELIGLEELRQKCPHFNRWITSLEQLGGA
jgi:hypothetical protein